MSIPIDHNRKMAAKLVDALLADLDGRAGFDRCAIDAATKREWREQWIKIVMERSR